MSKDGPLEAKPSFLAQPFYLATKVILAFPVATIAIGLLPAVTTATLDWTISAAQALIGA